MQLFGIKHVNLQKVSLGDIVTIYHKPLDINIKARCISYVYDCILDKYESIFAVNSSDDTYKEFLLIKESENKVFTRLIISIRNELKLSNKKNKK